MCITLRVNVYIERKRERDVFKQHGVLFKILYTCSHASLYVKAAINVDSELCALKILWHFSLTYFHSPAWVSKVTSSQTRCGV